MAATVTHKGVMTLPNGGNGKRMSFAYVKMNAASTAEVPAYLSRIDSASYFEIGNAGAADTITIDESSAVSDGSIDVPATGNVTLDLSGTSTREFFVTFIGV